MNYTELMPRQKLSRREKTEEWGKKNIKAALALLDKDNKRRSSKKDKQRNYDLYNGKFDENDMTFKLQPLDIKDKSFPAKMQYRDITSPIFNLLFGEESKRGLNFTVRAVNEDAISQKEKEQKEMIMSVLDQPLVSPEGEEMPTPKEIQKYYTYEYQDLRESVASKLLTYLIRQLSLEYTFQKGWEDVLLGGEELYEISVISNEPIARRLNPVGVDYLLDPNSDLIDDADIIVLEEYKPIGKIIDDHYEKLTSSQISHLEDFHTDNLPLEQQFFRVPSKDYIQTEEEIGSRNSNYLDEDGNMRVVKVIWKSRQKIGFRKYLDESGEQQEDVVSEDFKVDKENPDESVDWRWRNQYWEGTLIGDDIYIDIKPKRQQFRRMDNISACKSGIVGTIYNANNSKSVSLMDRLVPWIYLYITMWYRTELLMAANQGKIGIMDISLIPDGWKIDDWLYYATVMKFGFVNSFNEGKKGQSMGKLAGNISTQNKVLDLETGNAIQGHISILQFIEEKLHEVSGVTRQRKGQVESRELVGNVERTIVQSSHITEKWFSIHNWTKQRVLESLIEVAKDVWSEGSKKFQYVADDMASVFFTLDGSEFINSEYGVFVTNSSRDQQALNDLKQLTQAGLQNDKVTFSDIIDIYLNDSLADVKNKIKQSESEKKQAEQERFEVEQKYLQEQTAQKIQLEEDKIVREDINKEKDRQNKIDVAIIQAHSKLETMDKNRNQIPDILEGNKIEEIKKKLDLEGEKIKNKKEFDNKKQELNEKKQRDDIKYKQEKLKIDRTKSNKSSKS